MDIFEDYQGLDNTEGKHTRPVEYQSELIYSVIYTQINEEM